MDQLICNKHQYETIDRILIQKNLDFQNILFCWECVLEQPEFIKRHKKDIIKINDFKQYLYKQLKEHEQYLNNQNEQMPQQMKNLIFSHEIIIHQYNKSIDDLENEIQLYVDQLKQKLQNHLDQFQNKLEQEINKQKDIFMNDYTLFKNQVAKYFYIGQDLNCDKIINEVEEKIKNEDQDIQKYLKSIIQQFDQTQQYYDNDKLMHLYQTLWLKHSKNVKFDKDEAHLNQKFQETEKQLQSNLQKLTNLIYESVKEDEQKEEQNKDILEQFDLNIQNKLKSKVIPLIYIKDQQENNENQITKGVNIELKQKIQTDHESQLNCLLIINNKLITGSNDHLIRINQLNEQFQQIQVLKGHQDKVTCLSEFNNLLLSGSGNLESQIILWDIETSQKYQIYQGHKAQLTCIKQLTKDLFASGSYDNSAIIWRKQQSDPIIRLEKHKAVVTCLEYIEDSLLVGSMDKSISIWKLDFDSEKKIVNYQLKQQIEEKMCIQSMKVMDELLLIGGFGNVIKVLKWSNYELQKELNDANSVDDMILLQSKENDILILSLNSIQQQIQCWAYNKEQSQPLFTLHDQNIHRQSSVITSPLFLNHSAQTLYTIQNNQINQWKIHIL